MALPFAAQTSLLLALFVAAVAAATQNEGCDCERTCADIVAHQRTEILRLQDELRTLRGEMEPVPRRLSCERSWYVRSDADVEAFRIEGCRTVKTLSIGGTRFSPSTFTSLDFLSGLETAERLTISYNGELVSLAGLDNLSRVERLEVGDNRKLGSLAALESLETAGTLLIDGNDALESLTGLEGLETAGALLINGNAALESLTGLKGLETAETLLIDGNAALESLTGLENLVRVQRLWLRYNDRLRSLTGLRGLETAGSLTIKGNAALESLAGLEGIETADDLVIDNNAALESLTGLENLVRVEDLSLQSNDQLSSLAGLQGLETAGEITIKSNAALESLTGLENLVRVEDLSLESNYQLRSLAGLQGLKAARAVNIKESTWLRSLAGLQSLARVEEKLSIDHNPMLTSLDGLQGLESAYEIEVSDNWLLESLTGLEGLKVVGQLTLQSLYELRSIAALRNLTSAWHGGILIDSCYVLRSLAGLGTLRASQLQVEWSGLEFLGGPFATGSSVHVVRFVESWPPCVTPHERMALLSVVENPQASSIPNATWQPQCGPDVETFSCTKGQPCNFSLAGSESNTSVFVSARLTGCGACSSIHPQGHVAEGGRADFGYALRDEEAGLHSICRCAAEVGGPVAQLSLRGPRQSVDKICSRGRNCTFRLEGEALEPTDRVVLMSSCRSSNPSSGCAPNWTADEEHLLHDPSTWFEAQAMPYQVCWRAPCTSAPDGPTCPAPEDSYIHAGEVTLLGAYRRDYTPELDQEIPFSVSNIGLGVADGDQMRLRRACSEADEEEAYILTANSSGMVFDFGRLTRDRVEAGRHHLCWCQERDGAQCSAAWHFRADAGVVQIQCPAGQELVNSRRCESCPAGKQQPGPGLDPCMECPPGQFSRGATEMCEACPGGTVARRKGSSTCEPCLSWQVADPEAAGCSPDLTVLVLLALFCLFVGAFSAIFACGIRRQLSVVDVSLVQDQTIVTTYRSHGLTNVGRPSFPVKLQGTGHPGLDSPSRPFQARVKDAVRLELLTSAGGSINSRLDTSQGTLTVAFPHDLGHQIIVAVGLPVLFTAAAALGVVVVSAGLAAEALLGATGVALPCIAVAVAVRRRPRATPLKLRLAEFQRKLGRHRSVEKGPNRAIAIGKLHELLEFFHDFIRDRTAYYLDSNVLKQLTKAKRLSYAELVGPGQVEWFVSHFWGTPFEHFCTSLRKHAEMVCGQREWTALHYWVCFCSNNQYHIQDELGGEAGWVESSFYLTLKSGWCRGTCMVLDDKALPLTRIWCIFELLQTVKLERTDGQFQGLLLCTSSGVLNTGGGSPEVAMELADKVAGMNLQTAQATSEADARMIRDQVIEEMGSFTALNGFICTEMRAMLVRAQQHANQHFVDVLAHLDQTIIANAKENEEDPGIAVV